MPDFAVTTSFSVKEQLTQFFAKGERAATRFETMVSGAFKSAKKEASLFSQVLGGVTLGNLASRGVESLARGIKGTMQELPAFAEKADLLSKTSRSIGVSVESLQRFQYAAGLSNVSNELLTGGFQKLNNQMGQMKIGAGTLATTVGKLNPALALQLRQAKSSEQAFLIVAEAVKKTSSVQERATIAQAAFGKSGQEMLPMLLEGRAGLQALMTEASKYGTVIGDGTASAAEHFNDTLSRIKSGVEGVKTTVLSSVMTTIIPYIEKLAEWTAAHKDLIATKIDAFIKGAVGFMQEAIPIVRDLYTFAKEFGPAILAAAGAYMVLEYGVLAAAAAGKLFSLVNTIMFAFQAYAGGAATAQEALNLVMTANPIGLIVTGIAILIGLIVLLVTHWKQVSAAMQIAWKWIGKNKDMLLSLLGPLGLVVNSVIALVSHFSAIQASFKAEGFLGGLKTIGAVMMSMLISPLTQFLTLLSKIPGVGKLVSPALESLKGMQASFDATANRNLPRTAPNQEKVDHENSMSRTDVYFHDAPPGTTVKNSGRGPAQIRSELLGKNK
jgi:X-X-X-Leu-X-X-Gly heptad repeat protein